MPNTCFKSVFAASPDAVLVLRPSEGADDLDPEIVAANPAAAVLIGLAAEALVGQRLSEAVPAASLRIIRRAIGQAAAKGRSEPHETHWRSRGAVAHIRAYAQQTASALTLFLADVAELWRAREEIARQRREFAAASKVLATHAAHLAEAAAAAEEARAALLEEIALREELERELQRTARTDSLTGLLNRHGFSTEATRLVASAQRASTPLAAIIVDADHFKLINDQLGHAAGDAALAQLARLLVRETRDGIDVIGRMGGEEFVLLLPHLELERAADFAEHLRAGLAATAIAELRGTRLTASFGVAALAPEHTGFADLLREADEALYRAKRAGRNRVEVAGGIDDAAAA